MDKFIKNFIIMSIVYLAISSTLGVLMFVYPSLLTLKFVHSHLMLLGWVSMMIYGVGYHILPRFSGAPLKSVRLGEIQFYAANIGLIGMLSCYTLEMYETESQIYVYLTIAFGMLEVISIVMFFYNMLATLLVKHEEQ